MLMLIKAAREPQHSSSLSDSEELDSTARTFRCSTNGVVSPTTTPTPTPSCSRLSSTAWVSATPVGNLLSHQRTAHTLSHSSGKLTGQPQTGPAPQPAGRRAAGGTWWNRRRWRRRRPAPARTPATRGPPAPPSPRCSPGRRRRRGAPRGAAPSRST